MRGIVAGTVLAAVMFIAATAAFSAPKTKSAPTSFTLLASNSLTEAVTELLRIYSTRSNKVVTAIYGAPDDLVRGIVAGEAADLILMEDPALFIDLKHRGLLDLSTQTEIAGNRLVFAAAADHRYARLFPVPLPFEQFVQRFDELEMVLADPDTLTPGKAARQAFEAVGQWQRVEPLLVRAGSALDAAYLVALGRRTGVVYASDITHNSSIKLLAEIPETLHASITYQGAVVAGDYMQQGREFLEFLKTAEARNIFERHGFLVP